MWSFTNYENSYNSVDWHWRNLPFSDDISRMMDLIFVKKKFDNISILELGSAMGQGYNFLSNKTISMSKTIPA